MVSSEASPTASAIAHARALVAGGAERGVQLRVLGGVAIALRADPQTPRALLRAVNDLDLAVAEGEGRRAGEVLLGSGLIALSERFNTLHGQRRMMFVGAEDATLKVDVFVGDLEMCHTVPLGGRLELDPLTLTPTDLLLSKGQIVRLSAKDRLDLYCLLWNHEVEGSQQAGPEAASGNVIDADYIAELCAHDWGWWRTLSDNLTACLGALPELALSAGERERIVDRLTTLEQTLAAAPKSLRWRARSRVGDRVRWYEEPEEIEAPAARGADSTAAIQLESDS
jgi:hypothetical protein